MDGHQDGADAIYPLSSSDFVLLALLALVLVYVLPSVLLRYFRKRNNHAIR
jgi:hypothetical protein